MEQRLVDANELKRYVYRIDDSTSLATRDVVNEEDIDDAQTVLTIPESPTNGDIIKALFQNIEIEIQPYMGCVWIHDLTNDTWAEFHLKWWNAPWKGVNKDADDADND